VTGWGFGEIQMARRSWTSAAWSLPKPRGPSSASWCTRTEPRCTWRRFADFYAAQVRKGLFREADPWRAAMHIDGLCMAGPVQQLLEGAIDHVSDEELDAAADAAVDVFLRAYALEISTPREGRLS
jgi:AefR-like transcriptional repressor, C-terminal domain